MTDDASRVHSHFGLVSILVGIGVLYALGLNPFVMPESTDDITYHELGKSLAEGRGYTFMGEVISDWPPVYPSALSILISFGVDSLVLIKAFSVLSAIIALFLGYRLMIREKRDLPLLTILLLALFPTCFLYAVRTASEWPYLITSFGFFLVLHRLRDSRSWGDAILLGVLLGLSSLTRMVGVILGVAIVFQMVQNWWKLGSDGRFLSLRKIVQSVGLEGVAAFIGAVIFLLWRIYLVSQSREGNLALGNYDARGREMWTYFDPIALLEKVNELFFQAGTVLGKVGLEEGTGFAAAIVGGILLIGLVRIIREKRFQASDAYSLGMLLLLVSYEFKTTRFVIAIAPFMLGWWFQGLVWILSFVRLPARKLLPAFCCIWALGLLAMNGYLIFRGNDADHGPITGLISKSEDDFYQGLYSDLRQASHYIAERDPEAVIGIFGWYANYIYVFTGGQFAVNYEYAGNYTWFIETFEDNGVLPTIVQTGFEKVETIGGATIYRANLRN